MLIFCCFLMFNWGRKNSYWPQSSSKMHQSNWDFSFLDLFLWNFVTFLKSLFYQVTLFLWRSYTLGQTQSFFSHFLKTFPFPQGFELTSYYLHHIWNITGLKILWGGGYFQNFVKKISARLNSSKYFSPYDAINNLSCMRKTFLMNDYYFSWN